MITVTRLDGATFIANADLIETIEATPDTIITMTTGRRFIVREDVDEVVSKIVEFRSMIIRPAHVRVRKNRNKCPL